MKIGLYVGSFDPVHIGHIKIANYLAKNYVDKVIFVPTKNYWEKQNITNLEDRVNMLLTLKNNLIDVNSDLSKYDYTYEIMEYLKNKYNDMELYLIIGADNLEKFDLWKNVDSILKNNILVINRNNIDAESLINKFKENNKFILVNGLEQINISSTEIRNSVHEKKDPSKFLTKKVLKYINNNKLYGG